MSLVISYCTTIQKQAQWHYLHVHVFNVSRELHTENGTLPITFGKIPLSASKDKCNMRNMLLNFHILEVPAPNLFTLVCINDETK
jgi:hypothetical protein